MSLKETTDILSNANSGKKDCVISVLMQVQSKFGHISIPHSKEIAAHLQISLTKVYSVASYYDIFTFEKSKPFQIHVCKGLTCYKNGNAHIMSHINSSMQELFRNDKTKKELFALGYCNCTGHCQQAPIVKINNKIYANTDIQKITETASELANNIKKDTIH